MNMKFRHTIAVIPALIFWVVSVQFFIMGLSLHDQTGYMKMIAIALAVANTIIQLIGWDSDPNELGPLLFWLWIASYVLGIGTNIVSLVGILQIQNVFLKWIISGALAFMIEVSPERLFVLAWRSVSPKRGNHNNGPYSGGDNRRNNQNRQQHSGHQQLGQTPLGMNRGDYVRQQAQQQNRGQQNNQQQGRKQHANQQQRQQVPVTQVNPQVFRPEDLLDEDDGFQFFEPKQ